PIVPWPHCAGYAAPESWPAYVGLVDSGHPPCSGGFQKLLKRLMIKAVAHILQAMPKVSRGSDMKPFKFVFGLVLAIAVGLANAAPVDSAAQGYAGSNVTVLMN